MVHGADRRGIGHDLEQVVHGARGGSRAGACGDVLRHARQLATCATRRLDRRRSTTLPRRGFRTELRRARSAPRAARRSTPSLGPRAAAKGLTSLLMVSALEGELTDAALTTCSPRSRCRWQFGVLAEWKLATTSASTSRRSSGCAGSSRRRFAGLEARIYGLSGASSTSARTKQLEDVLFDELEAAGHEEDARPATRPTPRCSSGSPPSTKSRADPRASRARQAQVDTYARRAARGLVDPRRAASTRPSSRLTGDRPADRAPTRISSASRSERPIGRRIRHAFVAPEGTLLFGATTASIELRVLAHVSGDPALEAASASASTSTAAPRPASSASSPSRSTEERQRRQDRSTSASSTAMADYGLAQRLGIPRKDAQSFIDEVLRSVQGDPRCLGIDDPEARREGLRHDAPRPASLHPRATDAKRHHRAAGERMAANTPIQGTAADR